MTPSQLSAGPAECADRALTETPIDNADVADRRDNERFPPIRPARAEVYRLGMAAGPDFGDELLDVSQGGIRLRFCLAVRRGEQFDVTLWGPGGEWCGRYQAVARWVIRTGPGTTEVGLRLERPLPRRAVNTLTTPVDGTGRGM
jgi:hypothetical protein